MNPIKKIMLSVVLSALNWPTSVLAASGKIFEAMEKGGLKNTADFDWMAIVMKLGFTVLVISGFLILFKMSQEVVEKIEHDSRIVKRK